MVPTLRVVTQSMTLCVIRDVAQAVRVCGPKKRTDSAGVRTMESPTASGQNQMQIALAGLPLFDLDIQQCRA
jgi:hypothetical protein